MLYYWLKFREYIERKTPKVAKTSKGKLYENVQCVIVKN